jgi:hypothetical protein
MKNKPLRIVLGLTLACGLTTQPSFAQTAQTVSAAETVEDNAAQRINLSGKLRMLSQRIPSAACHLNQGIDIEGSYALLMNATTEFEDILTALEHGDERLNIQNAETRRKTLARIQELRVLWEPFKSKSEDVIAGTASDVDLTFVLTENLAVLSAAQLLVEELTKQYANPNATTAASLLLIDIAGRQRLLTQKVSKQTCVLGNVADSQEMRDDAMATIGIFDASLEALRFGMPAIGLRPPPNQEIQAGLDGVLADWESVKPLLIDVLDGAELDEQAKIEKFQRLNVTMSNMNTVVGMYAQAAP